MRLILKILAAPVIVVLTVLVWICALALRCSAFVCGLAGTLVGILGVAVLITYSVKNGIILLVIAFLISPIGIPMAAAWLLGQVQNANYAHGILCGRKKMACIRKKGCWPFFY